MPNLTNIRSLMKQLLPTGRAFKVVPDGWLSGLIDATSLSINKAVDSMLSIQDSILPDNVNFTEDDANDWERRLGMITSSGVLLSDRKLAIQRKINHPGTIKARQHYLYIQGQLQNAGFDVFVHENIVSVALGDLQHKEDLQHGQQQHGGSFGDRVTNYIDKDLDNTYYVTNIRSCFYIGGEILGDYANIPAARTDEFRQLIIRLKPCQMTAYLYINYL